MGRFFLGPIMANLTASQRKAMPAKEFAGGKPSGDKTGRFPLNDKAHIRAAESYERFATPAEKKRIDAAANKAFGKDRDAKPSKEREVQHPQSHKAFEDLGK
ncbi:hypothetical protein NKG59_15595 [Ralstonia sp. 21YRMH01-3]|uniref:Uncharacterized protein n=2 Tax=Ralstonia chuxiongensis TaxID=2957504 RepID=A0AA41WRD7_9RALS|nr:hypothetical protein [Ralstonia chuxiongensis]